MVKHVSNVVFTAGEQVVSTKYLVPICQETAAEVGAHKTRASCNECAAGASLHYLLPFI
jgi:hypothetical protein